MNGIELRCARIRRGKSTADMAELVGISSISWNQRERGERVCTLQEAALVSKALALTETEFADIFFDGILPFRKNSVV